MNFKEICKELEEVIVSAYQGSITLDEAERFSGRFLHAQMQVSEHLKVADLSSRMRKSGVKAVRAAAYLAECSKNEKKPSDVLIGAIVDTTPIVNQEQEALDLAEVERADLERYYDIFVQAHIYFRQLSKGVQG